MRPINENNPHYAILTVLHGRRRRGHCQQRFRWHPAQGGETYTASFWAYQASWDNVGAGDNSKPMPVTCGWKPGTAKCWPKPRCRSKAASGRRVSAKLSPARAVKDARLCAAGSAKRAGSLPGHDFAVPGEDVPQPPERTSRRPRPGRRRAQAEVRAFSRRLSRPRPGVHRYYDWKDTVGPVEERRAGRITPGAITRRWASATSSISSSAKTSAPNRSRRCQPGFAASTRAIPRAGDRKVCRWRKCPLTFRIFLTWSSGPMARRLPSGAPNAPPPVIRSHSALNTSARQRRRTSPPPSGNGLRLFYRDD